MDPLHKFHVWQDFVEDALAHGIRQAGNRDSWSI
jgi:hypothetical protein